MMRLTALTSSVRAASLGASRVSAAPAVLVPARAGINALRPIHNTAAVLDMATGADVVLEDKTATEKKPRAPRKKKVAADGDPAPATPKKARGGAKGKATGEKKSATKKSDDGAETTLKKAKKPAATKAATGPPKPKRVLHPPKTVRSAWLLYYKERLADMDPGEKKSVVELSQKLVEDFRKLSTQERDDLDNRFKAEHAKYEEELANWRSTVTPQMIADENAWRRANRKTSTKKANPRLLHDETKPRKPLNGYIRYCEYVRHNPEQSEKILGTANQGEIVAVEQAKALAAGWKALPDAEKATFNEAYQKDKVVYEKDLEAWKEEYGVTTA